MLDNYLNKIIKSFARTGKIPHLNIHLTGEELKDGSAIYECDTRSNSKDVDSCWIGFKVAVPPEDYSTSPQPIDAQAGTLNGSLSEEAVIICRVAYRIFEAYKAALKNVK